MYSQPPPGMGVPQGSNQTPNLPLTGQPILGPPLSSVPMGAAPLVTHLYHPTSSIHQVPPPSLPPAGIYTFPQQSMAPHVRPLGLPQPSMVPHPLQVSQPSMVPHPQQALVARPQITMASNAAQQSMVPMTGQPMATHTQQSMVSHPQLSMTSHSHQSMVSHPQQSMTPTQTFVNSGPTPPTHHAIQFSVPPPSLPAHFPPGGMQWPAASFSQNFPPAFAPVTHPTGAFSYPAPSYSAPPSRPSSPASRDRSPIKNLRDRSPIRNSRDRSPIRNSRDRSPIRNSRDRSPIRNSRDRSPVRTDKRYDDDYYVNESRDREDKYRASEDNFREKSDQYQGDQYRSKEDKFRGQEELFRGPEDQFRGPEDRPKSRSRTHRDRDVRRSTESRKTKAKDRIKTRELKRNLDLKKQKEELLRREDELARREEGVAELTRRDDGVRDKTRRREDEEREQSCRRETVDHETSRRREAVDREPSRRWEEGDREPARRWDDGDCDPSRRMEDGERDRNILKPPLARSNSDQTSTRASRRSIDKPSADRASRRSKDRSSVDRRSRRSESTDDRSSSILPSDLKIKKEEEEEENGIDMTKMTHEEIIAKEREIWIRSCPATLDYLRDSKTDEMQATQRSLKMQDQFEEDLIKKGVSARAAFPTLEPPRLKLGHHHHCDGSESSSSSEEEEETDEPSTFKAESLQWMETRAKDPNRLHTDIWQNMAGEMNDGPACRCPKKARDSGIRHNFWEGEEEKEALDPDTNNKHKLYHYRVTISPPTNFLISVPTMIKHDEHEFIFEGFSMFSRRRIPEDLPVCQIVRFNIEYSILFFEEELPENFTIRELELFQTYFFHELLELWDWGTDQRYFFMPRFVRNLEDNGKEILAMSEVLKYLQKSYKPLVAEEDLEFIQEMKNNSWQGFAEQIKGMIVHNPGKRPSAIRVDQLDRETEGTKQEELHYPDIVHFGMKPPQLCYAGNPDYQRLYRDFVKHRHLMANMPKPTAKDKQDLEIKEMVLQDMRSNIVLKRNTTVVVSSKGFHKTGLMTDIVQHALLLPVLVNHVRFYFSLGFLEEQIDYKFNNRSLLQQALTHPSYKENFGTNPDHMRNTLSNCGIRQPEYGDKKVHIQNQRKRGINVLINIMSRFGKKDETESKVKHNERLEFLGDAVVEFITSVHLFYMFPDLEEGGLATYRSAIVLNQHLAVLAGSLGLEKYILFSHGSDLCHDSELRHAMANCFEAFLGAVFLDGGINVADKVFGSAMFGSEFDLHETWVDIPHHPLQTQEPGGDRHWIPTFPVLQKLVEFEKSTGMEFKHIRLLARAFTDRSLGFNNLTLGSNQRLEFLGDTVLQLVTSEFLYKHFPEHHEGHLSLLRASLVNNRTQSVVCDDLGMTNYAAYANAKNEFKVKDKADLLEALVGALYVDQDLYHCQVFAEVCFFPRLQQFIVNQDWNDPKSKLQQCCLTLRTMDGGEPDIPIYKVIECKGPSNTRLYTVAVYFRSARLAKSTGHSIQMAEFNAAKKAIEDCGHLFPHLTYQKRVLERSFKSQGLDFVRYNWQKEVEKKRKEIGMTDPNLVDSKTDIKKEADEQSNKKNRNRNRDVREKKRDDQDSSKKRRKERKSESDRTPLRAAKPAKTRSTEDHPRDVDRRNDRRSLDSDYTRVKVEHWQHDDRSAYDTATGRWEQTEAEQYSRYERRGEDINLELRTRYEETRREYRSSVAADGDKRESWDHKRTDRRSTDSRRRDEKADESWWVADRDIRVRRESTDRKREEADPKGASSRKSRARSTGRSHKEAREHGKGEVKGQKRDGKSQNNEGKSHREGKSQGRESTSKQRDKTPSEGKLRIKTEKSPHTESSQHRSKSRHKPDSIKDNVQPRKSSRRESESSRRRESVSKSPRKSQNSTETRSQPSKSPRNSDRSKQDKSVEKIRPPSTTRKTQGEDQSKDLLESPASKLDRVHKEIKEIEHKLAKKKSKVVKTKPVMESSSAAGPSETTSNNLESIKPLKSKNKTEISANQEIRQTSIDTSDNQSSVTTKDFETRSNSQHNNQNITEETQTPGVSTEKDSTLNKNMTDPFQVDAKVEPEKEKEIIREEKLEDQESTKSGEIAQITGKIVEKELKKSGEGKEEGEEKEAEEEKEEGEVEEGECEESEEDDEPAPVVVKDPTPPPKPLKSPTKKKIEIKWKKTEGKEKKVEEKEKGKERKGEKEKTAKEIEREEKKKRWRKESPKKRVDKREEFDRLSKDEQRSRSRKTRRSPSPRDRDPSKRLRGAEYDRYERYDYPARSPPLYWPAEYYDRAFRSPPRSLRSPSRAVRSPRSPSRSLRSPSRDRYRSDRHYERDPSPDDIVNVSYFIDS